MGIAAAGTAFSALRRVGYFLDFLAGLRVAFFATLRFAVLRFADLRAGFLAAALRTVAFRFGAFFFLFAVIGIETTPSTWFGQARHALPKNVKNMRTLG
jgi:hypothetical protein